MTNHQKATNLYEYIDTREALELFVQATQSEPWMAFDTEFIGERRFKTDLCLVQVKTSKGIYIIDPITIVDITPFVQLITNPEILKITHAGDNDYRLLYSLYGVTPVHIFDTQVAAAFLGGKHPIAYRKLVEQELNKSVSKDLTIADWSKRPLAKDVLLYALYDVEYLPTIWQQLSKKLEDVGRLHWVVEECGIWEDKSFYEFDPHREALESSIMRQLDFKERVFLLRLMKWRRNLAEKQNYSKEMVLPSKYLSTVAKGIKGGTEGLMRNRRMPANITKEHGNAFYDLYKEPVTDNEKLLIRSIQDDDETLGSREELILETLYLMARMRCEEQGIAHQLVLSKGMLKKAKKGDVSWLKGWRKELLGAAFENLLLQYDNLVLQWEDNTIRVVVEAG